MTHASRSERDARDGALVDRIRNGNALALDELLRAYATRLLDVALPYVGSDDAAKDVVQDTFIKLWDTRDRLVIHGSTAAYLYRAVRNRALNARDHHRAQRTLHDHIAVEHDREEPRVTHAGDAALT